MAKNYFKVSSTREFLPTSTAGNVWRLLRRIDFYISLKNKKIGGRLRICFDLSFCSGTETVEKVFLEKKEVIIVLSIQRKFS